MQSDIVKYNSVMFSANGGGGRNQYTGSRKKQGESEDKGLSLTDQLEHFVEEAQRDNCTVSDYIASMTGSISFSGLVRKLQQQ